MQGSSAIDVFGFVAIDGDFGFEKTVTVTPAAGATPEITTTKILVGAANVNIFFGTADKSLGVKITNGSLGLLLLNDGTTLYRGDVARRPLQPKPHSSHFVHVNTAHHRSI